MDINLVCADMSEYRNMLLATLSLVIMALSASNCNFMQFVESIC